MKLPNQTKPALLGAIGGAIALAVVGFAWGGWTTSANADKMASERASMVVVRALAPICAHKFQQQPDADTQLTALKETPSYRQAAFIEKGGWAIMAGAQKAHSGTAKACAELLSALSK